MLALRQISKSLNPEIPKFLTSCTDGTFSRKRASFGFPQIYFLFALRKILQDNSKIFLLKEFFHCRKIFQSEVPIQVLNVMDAFNWNQIFSSEAYGADSATLDEILNEYRDAMRESVKQITEVERKVSWKE